MKQNAYYHKIFPSSRKKHSMRFLNHFSIYSFTHHNKYFKYKEFFLAILPLPLIQVGQLSVAGEIECALSTG